VFKEVAYHTFAVRSSCDGGMHHGRKPTSCCGFCRSKRATPARQLPHPHLRCPRCGSDNTLFITFSDKNAHGVRHPRHACKVRHTKWAHGGRRGGSGAVVASPLRSAQTAPDVCAHNFRVNALTLSLRGGLVPRAQGCGRSWTVKPDFWPAHAAPAATEEEPKAVTVAAVAAVEAAAPASPPELPPGFVTGATPAQDAAFGTRAIVSRPRAPRARPAVADAGAGAGAAAAGEEAAGAGAADVVQAMEVNDAFPLLLPPGRPPPQQRARRTHAAAPPRARAAPLPLLASSHGAAATSSADVVIIEGGDAALTPAAVLHDVDEHAFHVRAVAPGLWLGSSNAAANAEWLRARGITHVVNAAREVPSFFPDSIEYLRLELVDSSDAARKLQLALPGACDFIDAALQRGGGVLVHCQLGKSRSAAVVVAYAMLRRDWALERVQEVVRAGRSGLSINLGFQTLLGMLHAERTGAASVRSMRRR
jgi:hypothetical protein